MQEDIVIKGNDIHEQMLETSTDCGYTEHAAVPISLSQLVTKCGVFVRGWAGASPNSVQVRRVS